MTREIVLTREAVVVYEGAFDWYFKIDESLATALELEIERILIHLQEVPTQFPVVDGETHRAILKGFHMEFFLIDDNKIIVNSILHHRREPKLSLLYSLDQASVLITLLRSNIFFMSNLFLWFELHPQNSYLIAPSKFKNFLFLIRGKASEIQTIINKILWLKNLMYV